MKIMIASIKGGTGKSTTVANIATRLAKLGRDVCILDSDRQPSASTWIHDREEAGITPAILCVQKFDNIRDSVISLGDKYQDILVDVGGRDSKAMRTGLTAVDLVVVTSKASQLDLDTIPAMLEIIEAAKDFNPALRVLGLITMAPTGFLNKEKKETRDYFADYPEITLLNTVIHERKIYRDSMSNGLSVCESSNSKARNEIELLVNEILSYAKT
jgi:chromosome partitioning protein